MPLIYIGIGSNQGPREHNLARGLQLLVSQGFRVVKHAAIYETEPVGMPGARKFLNTVVAAETDDLPIVCMAKMLVVERIMGRAEHERNVPRKIDLDLLFYGNQIVRTAKLTVPHPRLHERAFVLVPLAEIAPKLVHPVLRRQVSSLLKATGRKGVKRWPSN